jgi:hypothetical protein
MLVSSHSCPILFSIPSKASLLFFLSHSARHILTMNSAGDPEHYTTPRSPSSLYGSSPSSNLKPYGSSSSWFFHAISGSGSWESTPRVIAEHEAIKFKDLCFRVLLVWLHEQSMIMNMEK